MNKAVFNKINKIIIRSFIICSAFAIGFVGTSHAMTSANYEIPSLAISGGGAKMNSTNYEMQDIKGQGVIGETASNTYKLGLGGIYGSGPTIVLGDWPYGTVPLNITRDNTNIKITWDAKIKNPKIYVLTGDGKGSFTNAFESWKIVTDLAGEFDNVTSGGLADSIIIHNKQVGGDPASHPECYYRGLQSGVPPAAQNPKVPGKTYFASALAVGKVNVVCKVGYNLISLPFLYGVSDKMLENVFGTQLTANDNPNIADEVYYKQNSASWGMTNAFQKLDGKWYLSAATTTPVNFTIIRENGYLISVKSQEKVITAVGNVSLDPQAVVMKTGYNAIGIVFPIQLTLDALGLLNVTNVTAADTPTIADEIYLKKNPNSWGMTNAFIKQDGKWYLSASPSTPTTFSFELPNGYYYSIKKANTTIDWQRKAP